jgi:hypothetical protein
MWNASRSFSYPTETVVVLVSMSSSSSGTVSGDRGVRLLPSACIEYRPSSDRKTIESSTRHHAFEPTMPTVSEIR